MGLLGLQTTPEDVLLECLRGDKRDLGVLGVFFPRSVHVLGWECHGLLACTA